MSKLTVDVADALFAGERPFVEGIEQMRAVKRAADREWKRAPGDTLETE